MKKHIAVLILGLVAVGGAARADVEKNTPATKAQVMEALYDEYQTGECFKGEFVSADEVTEGWQCTAQDCTKTFEGAVKVCLDHAKKSAMAVCERKSADKSQCKLTSGTGECCKKPFPKDY